MSKICTVVPARAFLILHFCEAQELASAIEALDVKKKDIQLKLLLLSHSTAEKLALVENAMLSHSF